MKKKHAEILVALDRQIPSELMEKYSYLTWAEMAKRRAFKQYKQLLLQAEHDWNEVEGKNT